ncbi:hypothetical protein EJ08DRAFT_704626 [Tothia fuscella]|uniref:Uncharacterized protein n=1 Tax=Tothia fuscella TaxID=1048955 RepID=A0A9P4P460_9PEZI|nr:hypothetical protein EJ08DRAFT_704626 [Tothia fuscella]
MTTKPSTLNMTTRMNPRNASIQSGKEPVFNFLNLPRELRDMIYTIYTEAFGSPPRTYNPRPSGERYAFTEPTKRTKHSLLRVNQQIYHEIIEIVYKDYKPAFHVEGSYARTPLADWRMSCPLQTQIKECAVVFDTFASEGANALLSLNLKLFLRKFTVLESLEIEITPKVGNHKELFPVFGSVRDGDHLPRVYYITLNGIASLLKVEFRDEGKVLKFKRATGGEKLLCYDNGENVMKRKSENKKETKQKQKQHPVGRNGGSYGSGWGVLRL